MTQSDDYSKLTFEQAMEQLESLVADVESGESGLEASIGDVAKGAKLIAHCRSILDASEKKIASLNLEALTGDDSESEEGEEIQASLDDEPMWDEDDA